MSPIRPLNDLELFNMRGYQGAVLLSLATGFGLANANTTNNDDIALDAVPDLAHVELMDHAIRLTEQGPDGLGWVAYPGEFGHSKKGGDKDKYTEVEVSGNIGISGTIGTTVECDSPFRQCQGYCSNLRTDSDNCG